MRNVARKTHVAPQKLQCPLLTQRWMKIPDYIFREILVEGVWDFDSHSIM